MTNKEIALTINQAIQSGNVEIATELVTDTYIQHTPVVSDGRKGFKSFLNKIKNFDIPVPKLKTVRVIEEGEFVVLHHEVYWPNRKAMFEIYRFEEGLAAEHWSAIMDHPESTVNGNSMFDGETKVKDQDKTQSNKELVRSLMNEVYLNGNYEEESILKFFHPDVIQHHPFLDGGANGLINRPYQLEEQGLQIQTQQIHYIIAEGNFVLTFSEGTITNDEPKTIVIFDLFRIENEKVMEQWGIFQEVPDLMDHTNGMFRLPLYRRIGGYDGIAEFIDHAFPQVASHPDLQHFFIGHSNATKMRQRQLIIDSLSNTLKGPTVYLGKPLKEIHRGLNITVAQWDTFMKIIDQSMDDKGIKGDTKLDFLNHFESFRSVTVEEELDNVD